MNRLITEGRVRVISCLVERNSIRSTVRMTGVAKNTVIKLLVDIGHACSEYQDKVFRSLKCKRMELGRNCESNSLKAVIPTKGQPCI